MNDAKTAMLARIRAALNGAAPAPAIPRAYQQDDARPQAQILDEFEERLIDYNAQVTRVASADLAQSIAEACAAHGIALLAAPTDIPAAWLPSGLTVRRDEPPLTHADLDRCEGVITGCFLAIAQTGTIILNSGATQGRRALSLVPDVHLCVVHTAQVVGNVPQGIALLAHDPTHPITFISGPSATSDIELSRVQGVHGPRTLHVFVVL